MSDVLEYPYRAPTGKMLLGAGFFGGCAVVAIIAARSGKGLIINHLIELEPRGAAIFWTVVAALSLGFVVAALSILWIARTSPLKVRVTATEFSAPRFGFSRGVTVLPLREIRNVGVFAVGSQEFIAVGTERTTLNIARSMLPDDAAFHRLHARLRESLERSPAT